MPSPFHLAIPVDNLERCTRFYVDILGCETGRYDTNWIDLNLFGHQLVLHFDPNHEAKKHHNEVDGKSVPIPHFGVLLDWEIFESFSFEACVFALITSGRDLLARLRWGRGPSPPFSPG